MSGDEPKPMVIELSASDTSASAALTTGMEKTAAQNTAQSKMSKQSGGNKNKLITISSTSDGKTNEHMQAIQEKLMNSKTQGTTDTPPQTGGRKKRRKRSTKKRRRNKKKKKSKKRRKSRKTQKRKRKSKKRRTRKR